MKELTAFDVIAKYYEDGVTLFDTCKWYHEMQHEDKMNKRPTQKEVQEKFGEIASKSNGPYYNDAFDTVEYFLNTYQPEITIKQALELLIEKGCEVRKGVYYAPYGNGPVENCIHWFIEAAELEPKPEPIVTLEIEGGSDGPNGVSSIKFQLKSDQKFPFGRLCAVSPEKAKQIYDILKGED